MKEYKCIIFDCDGVLVDSEVLGNQVFVDMANENGAEIDISYAMQHFKGGFLMDSIKQVEAIIQKSLPLDFEREYRHRSYQIFSTHLKPVDGIQAVLEKLTVPFCVASSGPQEKIKKNLATAGLLSFLMIISTAVMILKNGSPIRQFIYMLQQLWVFCPMNVW